MVILSPQRRISKLWCIFVHQVPAYIWISEKLRSKYPDEVCRLRQVANRPLYNSYLVHTIVDVAEIELPTLNSCSTA